MIQIILNYSKIFIQVDGFFFMLHVLNNDILMVEFESK